MSAPAGDVAIAELDRARRRQVEAGEHVDERRLAGAVRPDQPTTSRAVELERDLLQRLDACERTRNGGGPKGFFGPPLDPACRRRISQLELRDDLCPHQALKLALLFWIWITRYVAPVDGVQLRREADPPPSTGTRLNLTSCAESAEPSSSRWPA
jgi:hypothetical protein